jgi:hypothetical protein
MKFVYILVHIETSDNADICAQYVGRFKISNFSSFMNIVADTERIKFGRF